MKEKCLEFMQDLESKDLSKISNWFNDNSLVWIPPGKQVEGVNRILALFRAIFRRYEKLHWKVVEIYELGNNRLFYISESWGIKDNEPYHNKIVTDITFGNEGQITHLSDYFKDTACFLPPFSQASSSNSSS
jgi:SnoaL-like domain